MCADEEATEGKKMGEDVVDDRSEDTGCKIEEERRAVEVKLEDVWEDVRASDSEEGLLFLNQDKEYLRRFRT